MSPIWLASCSIWARIWSAPCPGAPPASRSPMAEVGETADASGAGMYAYYRPVIGRPLSRLALERPLDFPNTWGIVDVTFVLPPALRVIDPGPPPLLEAFRMGKRMRRDPRSQQC